GGAFAQGKGGSRGRTHTDTQQETWSASVTKGHMHGDAMMKSDTDTATSSAGRGETLDIREGFLRNRFPTFNSSDGVGNALTRGSTIQSSVSEAETAQQGGSTGSSDGYSVNKMWNEVLTNNWADGESENRSISYGFKLLTLARIIREKQRT